MKWPFLLAGSIALAACGGTQKQIQEEQEGFSCRDRSAAYLATHTMAGDEVGVQIDCAQMGPRLVRWRTDKAGKREEHSRALTPGEFDKIWQEIDGTGWPNMQDCTNGSGNPRDPIYQFTIQDDQNKASFSCQSRTMPYPYNDLSDPLDMAAARGSRLEAAPVTPGAGART